MRFSHKERLADIRPTFVAVSRSMALPMEGPTRQQSSFRRCQERGKAVDRKFASTWVLKARTRTNFGATNSNLDEEMEVAGPELVWPAPSL